MRRRPIALNAGSSKSYREQLDRLRVRDRKDDPVEAFMPAELSHGIERSSDWGLVEQVDMGHDPDELLRAKIPGQHFRLRTSRPVCGLTGRL